MKLITKFKSKNFDSRRSNKIIHIIIHYTALDSLNEAIEFLCEPSNKVSCHYLISSKGEIYNLLMTLQQLVAISNLWLGKYRSQ